MRFKMAPQRMEIKPGTRFGELSIIKELPSEKYTRWFLCKCDCGNKTRVSWAALRRTNESTKSCGHLQRSKDGWTQHPIRTVHMHMLSRCYDKTYPRYSDWGGRGIRVCKEWRDPVTGLINFAKWAIKNGWKKGLYFDRENNDGDYEPSNCRFISARRSILNRRSTKMGNDPQTGELRPLLDIFNEHCEVDIGYIGFVGRLNRGASLEDALSKPYSRRY
jgi:hypothetical protein